MRWLALAALLAAVPALAQPDERRFYGRDGGRLGTERPGPGGETRLYDRSGRLEGTTRPRAEERRFAKDLRRAERLGLDTAADGSPAEPAPRT